MTRCHYVPSRKREWCGLNLPKSKKWSSQVLESLVIARKMSGLSVPIALSCDIFCWFFNMRLGNSGKFCLSSVNSTNFATILEIFAKILISQN